MIAYTIHNVAGSATAERSVMVEETSEEGRMIIALWLKAKAPALPWKNKRYNITLTHMDTPDNGVISHIEQAPK